MRKLVLCAILGSFALAGFGQAEIPEFPRGTTEMVWALRGVSLAQELRLAVEGLGDGRYRVTLGLSLEGSGAELSVLGFLGAPFLVQSMGTQIDLSALLVLIRRREALGVGETYALPGGSFYVREKREIAGVTSLVGEFRPADRADRVIEVGLSLSDPVYLFPLLRVTERERVTFELILTQYRRP